MCISLYLCADNVKFIHIKLCIVCHVLLVTCVFIWSLKISVIVLALEIKRLVICQILMHWGQQLQCPFHWRNPQYRVSCISHVAMTFPSPLSKIIPTWSHKVTFISLSTCMQHKYSHFSVLYKATVPGAHFQRMHKIHQYKKLICKYQWWRVLWVHGSVYLSSVGGANQMIVCQQPQTTNEWDTR